MAIVIGKIVNDEITDGVIYNPILNEFFWASLGKGSLGAIIKELEFQKDKIF